MHIDTDMSQVACVRAAEVTVHAAIPPPVVMAVTWHFSLHKIHIISFFCVRSNTCLIEKTFFNIYEYLTTNQMGHNRFFHSFYAECL